MSKHADELTRKDMKAPDAFQTAAGKAATWLTGKQKTIVAAVVGALVVWPSSSARMGWWTPGRAPPGRSSTGPSTTPTGRSPAFRSRA